MTDYAIRFENVGKEYRVGASQGGGVYRYQSLGERLTGLLRNPFRAAGAAIRRPASDSFWALKDVSFDVKPGEVVGVIGRNGAGKSTLLKVLSQITKPTEGQIAIRGRVGSLLEVGTGFHPELTGRENIFLNGAILGMKQSEVRKKFDEIVDFSEVERFLDTPVKQYSSGMYTRLAFAVAAHLDPEILVVDEVLAVGDAQFQKKCLGKMQDVASGGRTVLFVSHNMAAVARLCTMGVLLDNGQVSRVGDIEKVVAEYHKKGCSFSPAYSCDTTGRSIGVAKVVGPGTPIESFSLIEIAVDVVAEDTAPPEFDLAIGFRTVGNSPVLQYFSYNDGVSFQARKGNNQITVKIPALPLVPGEYFVSVWIGGGHQQYELVREAIGVTVVSTNRTPPVESRGYPILGLAAWTNG